MRQDNLTDAERDYARAEKAKGRTYHEIALALGISSEAVRHIFRRDRRAASEPPKEEPPPMAPPPSRAKLNSEAIERARHIAANQPVDVAELERRIRELEAANARLVAQKEFETHAEFSGELTGGKMTLRFSDHHYADENHLLSCAASLAEKFLVLVERYQPDEIQIVGGDDWIAGRGIFREQDLSLAVSDVDLQVEVGAVKWFRFLRAVRDITNAPISIEVLEGNHESAPGRTRLGPSLFDKSMVFCQPISGLSWRYNRHRALINLASAGYHNVLAYHGYGHSKTSPNSPAFIEGAKEDIIALQQKLPPEQHIRRVLSGHTHWHSVDLERIRGIAFDTTGGLQRNDRVQLHKSSRPVGWIVYISPPGSSEINQPIKLSPDSDAHARELADPHLCSANRADCAECITFYESEMANRGLLNATDPIGTTGGRW